MTESGLKLLPRQIELSQIWEKREFQFRPLLSFNNCPVLEFLCFNFLVFNRVVWIFIFGVSQLTSCQRILVFIGFYIGVSQLTSFRWILVFSGFGVSGLASFWLRICNSVHQQSPQ